MITNNQTRLNAEQLRKLVSYDPETGDWAWLENGLPVHVTIHPKGYRLIYIGGHNYRAARLAWLYQTGEWPPKGYEVDHRDCNASNDAWDNLRLATHAQNCWNQRRLRRNASGFKGVSFQRSVGKFRASIRTQGQYHYLGLFPTAIEAYWAVRKARNKLHGAFARNY